MPSRPRVFSSVARTRRIGVAALTMVAMLAVSLTTASASPPQTVTGLTPIAYTEGSGPVTIAPNAVVTQSGSFADGYLEFSIAGATATESLALPQASSPAPAAGVVSVVGTAIYLGLGGTDFKQIGTVDPVRDGLAGSPLRINFAAVLPNADFSGAVTGGAGAQTPDGWTINRNFVTLGSVASKSQGNPVTKSGSGPYTISGPGYSFVTDVDYDPAQTDFNGDPRTPWAFESKERGQHSTVFNSDLVAFSGHADSLQLSSLGYCPGPNDSSYCAVFGPEAFSSTFVAKAGDSLAFDWAAANGGDNYEVYGFLVNQDTSVSTELMYGRGGIRGWSTTSGTIPADGNYRFRFVSGSYDMTGGLYIGASLYIDNVRVLSSSATAAVAQSITRLVQYENTSDNPPATRTITVATAVAGAPPVTATVPTVITAVDDAPAIGSITAPVFTNTIATESFTTATGTIPAVDPEGDTITYGLTAATPTSTVIGGVTYDLAKVGTYGTAYVASTTGAWAYVPDPAAINSRLSSDIEAFAVTATANGLTGSGSLPIAISVPASVPGSATAVSATGANASADLTWTVPVWIGGSAVIGYKVERSLDGTTWTTAIANTSSATPTAQVTGLTNGTPYLFRVSAINTTGPSAVSASATATPGTVPDAPTAVTSTPSDTVATVSWVTPASNGGRTITGYRIDTSTNGGSTWTVAITNTGSTATTSVVNGLTNGALTEFRVVAINVLGSGAPSASTNTTPRTTPGAPSSIELTPGNGWIVARWAPPTDDGGSPLTGYRVETSTDGATWTVAIANSGNTATSALLSSLVNGTPVRVRVSAINAAGTGGSSATAVSTPRTVAGAPTITSVTAGNRQLTVTFTPPSVTGGTAITNHQYSVDGGTTWVDAAPATTTGPIVIVRLENGEPVTVRLRAVNAAGVGAVATGNPSTPVAMPVARRTVGSPTANGGGQLLVDGTEGSLTLTNATSVPGNTSPAGTLRATGSGVTVDLLARDQHGAAVPLDGDGNMELVAGASTEVSGTGFRPGSTVDIWLMPGTILLGTIVVGADGTFSTSMPVPSGTDLGDHTLQLNGVGSDGATRTVTIDVAVRGATAERTSLPTETETAPLLLALTGGSTSNLMLLGVGMVVAGVVITSRRRRRAVR